MDASITIDGKPGKLAELPAGAFVNLPSGRGSQDDPPHRPLRGRSLAIARCPVKTVDVKKCTITFADKAGPRWRGKPSPSPGTPDILINGKPGKLAELPAGSAVSGRLRVDQEDGRHDLRKTP